MSKAKDYLSGIADEAAGLAKRAIGELTARPDFVIEGEKQQTQGRSEIEAAAASDAQGPDLNVIGWKLDPVQRQELLRHFPPRYGKAMADHVVLASDTPSGAPLPPSCDAAIVGQVDDLEGVQAMVVTIDASTDRPDGGTFHITWSLGPGRRAAESNHVLERLGWTPLAQPHAVSLQPAKF